MSSAQRLSSRKAKSPSQASQGTPTRPTKRVKIDHDIDSGADKPIDALKREGSASDRSRSATVASPARSSRAHANGHHEKPQSKPSSHRLHSLGGRQSNGSRAGSEASIAPEVTVDEHRVAREKLKKWLEKRAATVIFPITLLPNPEKQGVLKGKSKVYHDELKVDQRPYGRAAFTVKFQSEWNSLKQYRKCLIQDETYSVGDCVLVYSGEADGDEKTDASLWKAQIREVRAFDEDHVYLRVTWLLRPDIDMTDFNSSFYDAQELVPSDEMTIIDAKSVDGRMTLRFWNDRPDESDENAASPVYYWQQCYSSLTKRYTPEVRLVCKCVRPADKRQPMLQCWQCDRWMHETCLEVATVKMANQCLREMEPLTPRDSSTDDEDGRRRELVDGEQGTTSVSVGETGKVDCRVLTARLDKRDMDKPMMVLTREIPGVAKEIERDVHCLFCAKVIEAPEDVSDDSDDLDENEDDEDEDSPEHGPVAPNPLTP